MKDKSNASCNACGKTWFVEPGLFALRSRRKCWDCGGTLTAMSKVLMAEGYDLSGMRREVFKAQQDETTGGK